MSYVKPVIRGLRAKPRELLGDVVLSQSEACTEGKNAAGARTRKGLARKHARMSVSGAASLVGRERGRWILSAQFHEAKIRAATIKFKIHSLRDFCRVHAFKKKRKGALAVDFFKAAVLESCTENRYPYGTRYTCPCAQTSFFFHLRTRLTGCRSGTISPLCYNPPFSLELPIRFVSVSISVQCFARSYVPPEDLSEYMGELLPLLAG